MQTDVARVDAPEKARPAPALILLCADLPQIGLDLGLLEARIRSRSRRAQTRVVGNLCGRPAVIRASVEAAQARRLVLGVCRRPSSDFEVQAQIRRAGLDPFGVQIVILGERLLTRGARPSAESRAVALLCAAVARATAFRESSPDNSRAVLVAADEPVSRRALFTLPPIVYEAAPVIDRDGCAAADGCDRCVAACPHDALTREGASIVVDRANCASCGICVAACPQRAVHFPGASADEIEAQLASLLRGDIQPGMADITFVCRKSGPALGGGVSLPVDVACLSMVPAAAALRALAGGARAVEFRGCGAACRQDGGQTARGTVEYCRQLLESLGDSPERVRLSAPGDPGIEAAAPAAATKSEWHQGEIGRSFGRGAAADAVTELAATRDNRDLAFEHPQSPLGGGALDRAACTGCGTCAVVCPTDALSEERDGDAAKLLFDPSLCMACGECERACPERAAGAITQTAVTDLSLLRTGRQVVFSGSQVRCEACGTPFASRQLIARLTEMLGEDGASESMGRLCPECRGVDVLLG